MWFARLRAVGLARPVHDEALEQLILAVHGLLDARRCGRENFDGESEELLLAVVAPQNWPEAA